MLEKFVIEKLKFNQCHSSEPQYLIKSYISELRYQLNITIQNCCIQIYAILLKKFIDIGVFRSMLTIDFQSVFRS